MIPPEAIKPIRRNGRDSTEIAVGTLIAYRVFPQTQEGIEKAKQLIASSDKWLVPSMLPEYYDGIDSDLMTGKENDAIRAITRQLKEFYGISSASVETPVDTRVVENNIEISEELKAKLSRTVNHPKLYPDLQKIYSRYMWGQNGLYELEFKSGIDKAIYESASNQRDKEGYYTNKLPQKKIDFREWLFQVTGLTYRDDFDEIKTYRKKILEIIKQILNSGLHEDPVIVPPVYDGYYQDPDEDEEEDGEEEDLEDDLDGLDDLLDLVRAEDEESVEEKEVAENIEEQIVDAIDADEQEDEEEGDIGSEDDIPDELLQDELDPEFVERLVVTVNKRKTKSRKQTTGTYISNTKIFKFLTTNLYKIQGQLDSIDKSLQEQTQLVQANLQITAGIYENLDIQNEIIGQKLDAILQIFNKQTETSKQLAEDEERRSAEQRLESQVDVAGTETPTDLRGKGGGKKRQSKIGLYYKRKLLRKLYKKTPKQLRSLRTKARNIQKIPDKLKTSAANRITKMLPQKAGKAISNLRSVKSIGKNLPGLRQVLATLEYSDRKSAGQSNLQAVAGVGAGLGGAAAGGAAGVATGAAIGAALGLPFFGIGAAPGAAIGSAIGGVLGLVGGFFGGNAASGVADKLTGADKITGEHEIGGLTKPGTAILHGMEAIVDKDAANIQPVDPVGGTILAATTQYINKLGPIGAPIAPMFEQVAAPLAKVYDIPNTLVQANVGGSLPSLQSTIKKVRDKKKKTPEEELGAMEKDLLETKDPESFADKLLKMLDPEGKFQEILKNLNKPVPSGGAGGEVGADPFVLLGGSQDPGQAGIDFTLKGTQNRAVLAGTVVEVKHQYNPNATGGDGRQGAGYGNYLVIRSTNPVDGSQVDMLYAHFPKGEIKVSKGDQVSVGQDLGRMATEADYANPATRKEVGSGTGPHTSLDFFQPGSNKAHTGARALGDYILKELGKGDKGAIEKARQQAYQQQQTRTQQAGPLPTAEGLGKQGTTGNKNFGATSGVGSKGYLIVPGHAAGGGAPEEKRLVKQLAKNAYTNLKSKFPDANVHYQDTDSMFDDTDEGFKKQLDWFKQKEKEGWEILEVHMDASMESGEGTGRGVIAPTGELNPVEAYFAQNYGAFTRGHRDLGAPKRGAGLFELGNMSPELEAASKQNKVSKKQLDALTAPLEAAIQSGLNISPPTQRQPAQSKYYLRQGGDTKSDTQIIMIPASSNAGKALEKNATAEGVGFNYNRNYNTFDTSELPSSTRALVLRRLGLN